MLAACCPLPAARANPPEVVPVDGKPFAAELAAAGADWQLTFKSAEKSKALQAGELVCWGTPVEPRRGPLVVLTDGGILPAAVLRADRKGLLADSFVLLPTDPKAEGLELPRQSVAGVIYQMPADRHRNDLLMDRVAGIEGKTDRLLLADGDEISGTIQAVEEETIRLVTDVGPIDVDTYRVRALIFNPALRRPVTHEGPRAWAGFRDGARLLVTGLTLDEKSLAVTLSAGPKLGAKPADLVYLQPLGGRATYLSDLKAAGYRHVPFFKLCWPYRIDRNVSEGRLRAGGRLYLKGIGVHSAARLMYKVDGSYQRFEAAAAIDDSTGGRGSARFRVFVDGRQQYSSGPIRGGDPPLRLSVDVAGAKQLDLIVDYAERADELDHADWLDARLIE